MFMQQKILEPKLDASHDLAPDSPLHRSPSSKWTHHNHLWVPVCCRMICSRVGLNINACKRIKKSVRHMTKYLHLHLLQPRVRHQSLQSAAVRFTVMWQWPITSNQSMSAASLTASGSTWCSSRRLLFPLTSCWAGTPLKTLSHGWAEERRTDAHTQLECVFLCSCARLPWKHLHLSVSLYRCLSLQHWIGINVLIYIYKLLL